MSFVKKIWATIKPIVLNKYLLALVIFVVFVMFFDNHNMIKRWKIDRNVKQLEKEISYYKGEIEKSKEKMDELQSSDENLEKFAREQYLMKKENEDIFIIEE
ncbi:septum formation initiator family protein [Paludibacter sp. 221]|uniref:FtsB family cell division protein n=1 Tax=Paludibacter sp. 221 TaxID=2302939 RepID=UPI0013D49017|nr:septum formation initiator family protein [Paludibacter sp. 221]NDV47640.1 septum formation initiator family protein [Paludibacter sp. 221]